jgi:Tfp pilus assembly protein PilF
MEIPLTGTIKDLSLANILVSLNRNRKTGTLSLTTPSFTKKIYLDAGDAIFASSTYEDDRLGEMLLKADKITVEQYDRSVELLKSSDKRQGAILVDLGYITPKDLFWGVKYQVREIILGMFQITDAEYEFCEGEVPRQEVITLRMSSGNLICEGVRRIDNWTRIRKEMPDTDTVLRLSSDPLSLFRDVGLSPLDRKILSLTDGEKPISDIIEESEAGSFEALKSLYVLWSLGMVEAVPAVFAGALPAEAAAVDEDEPVSLAEILEPPSEEEETFLQKVDSLYSRLHDMTTLELLEIGEDSDEETAKRNYYRLTKEFHPDRYFTTADESVKSKLTAIFDAVTTAYNSLKEETQPLEPSDRAVSQSFAEPGREKEAEACFKNGVAEFKKGNVQAASDNFREAAELVPGNVRYWNYLSLCYTKMRGRLGEAEEALMTAISLDPFNADLYSNMGLINMKKGLMEKAHSNFEKALQIDPDNEKAMRGLWQTKGGAG